MIDGDRFVFGERDRVPDRGASLGDWSNSRDVIVLLQCVDNRLHGRDVRVHLRPQFFEGG